MECGNENIQQIIVVYAWPWKMLTLDHCRKTATKKKNGMTKKITSTFLSFPHVSQSTFPIRNNVDCNNSVFFFCCIVFQMQSSWPQVKWNGDETEWRIQNFYFYTILTSFLFFIGLLLGFFFDSFVCSYFFFIFFLFLCRNHDESSSR